MKKLSGNEYKKIREDKEKKRAELIKSIDISQFFQKTLKTETCLPTTLPTSEIESTSLISTQVPSIISESISAAAASISCTTNSNENIETNTNYSIESEKSEMVISNSTAIQEMDALLSEDPGEWNIENQNLIKFILINGFNQNMNFDPVTTKVFFEKENSFRYLNKKIFKRSLKNGEIQKRNFLSFSKSKNSLVCIYCLLFSDSPKWWNDWKHVNNVIADHEKSVKHKTAETVYISRKNKNVQIDNVLQKHCDNEKLYWKNVLLRTFAVIKKLAARGLPFRGKTEVFGSASNGNYMMGLELIAEFDPFLSEHIRKYGNPGRGNTSYLSSTICDEILLLTATLLRHKIKKEIHEQTYFGLIVDSTPDISHQDQLAIIIRYVLILDTRAMPIERFLEFVPNSGHKATEMEKSILTVFEKFELNLNLCRGQSYDNAANMSGIYNGLQAKIQQHSPLAVFIPCSAHSLNLIGTAAAEVCAEICIFFSFIDGLYVFFASSTRLWLSLISGLEKGRMVVKKLCPTRWAARADAVKAIFSSWNNIFKILTDISNSELEKPTIKSTAQGFLSQMKRFEFAILISYWNTVLERFNTTSKQLQAIETTIETVENLYESLIHFIEDQGNNFSHYEEKAEILVGHKDFETDCRRKRRRKRFYDEEQEEIMDGRLSFIKNTYEVVNSKLLEELKKRSKAYNSFASKFSFFNKLCLMDICTIQKLAQNLAEYYADDLDDSFVDEVIHFRGYLNSLKPNDKNNFNLHELYSLIIESELKTVYPNIEIVLRIFLTTPATNCSAERSFSALKRIKNCLRSTLGEEKLNAFAILSIEKELLNEIKFEEIFDRFIEIKMRKKL